MSVAKATVVPAGMALPFSSTTVTVNVAGTSPLTRLHGGIAIAAAPLMVILADELESTITWDCRTYMDFCGLQMEAPDVHNTPWYKPSPEEVAPTKLNGGKPLVVPTKLGAPLKS